MASFSVPFSHHHQQQRAISPHRTMVWTEPKPNKSSGCRKVPLVYYLCREDGQLEHPHFMEVLTSDARGRLCLRDFTDRLDMLRGKGMADMYSWSSKRSYRNNGFVWHDLTEDDTIHPAHANEYVLKGSRRFSTRHDHGRRGNHQSSFDLAEYKQKQQVPLSTDEISISPPPSSSSPGDTLEETLVTSGGRRRMLMQLISCGSVTVKSHSSRQEEKGRIIVAQSSSPPPLPEEGRDRDYFSGSLVETNKKKNTTAAGLKRSSSCNADRRLGGNRDEDTRSGARA